MLDRYSAFRIIILVMVVISVISCDEIDKSSAPGLTGVINVPEDFPTIQKAIDAAAQDGAIIKISDGVYKGEGNANIKTNGKHIKITGNANDPGDVVIDCGGLSRGITFTGGENRKTIIENLTITNANAKDNGAGMLIRGLPVISNCIISNNVSELAGGGVACLQGSMPLFRNCLFFGNRSEGLALFEGGGAIYCDRSEPTFVNCTISKNSANFGGGIFSFYKSTPTLINTIIYGNAAFTLGHEIYQYKGGTSSGKMSLISCAVKNAIGDVEATDIEQENCLYDDPGFYDSNNMNFGLLQTSVCVNAGDNFFLSPYNRYELHGLPRIAENTVDIGAYEFHASDLIADFSFEITEKENSIEVEFTDKSIGTPDSWSWDFNDDGQEDSADANPMFTYANTGLYTISLKVTKGASSSTSTFKHVISYVLGTEILVPDDFPNIQDAIFAASDGSKITIKDGTYTGYWNRNIDFMGKSLYLISGLSADKTVIDCEGKGRGFILASHEDQDAIIQGFTICNGFTEFNGGGIYVYDSDPRIRGCIVENCFAGDNGGGLYVQNSETEIEDCKIKDNEASSGAGLFVISSSCSVLSCEIAENEATSYGGGINVANLRMLIENSVIANNSAGYGAGLFISDISININNCLVVENEAFFNGGGFYLDGKSCLPKVQNCTVANNSAKQGGGIFVFDRAAPIYKNSIIWGNSASVGKQLYASISGEGTGSIIFTNCDYSSTYTDIYDLHDKLSANKDSILIDPRFTKLGNDKYFVATNSPCIDSGMGLATEFDFLMNRSIIETQVEDSDVVDIGYHYKIQGN